MKLVLCKACEDVFKLDYEERQCKCGKSKGKYFIDGLNAEYSGEQAMPLGFDNNSLRIAVNNQPEDGWGFRFTAFVIQKDCKTFVRKD